MTGETHYDFEVLAELAEGLLDVTTAAQVREHLAVCDSCGECLAELAAVREMLAAVPVPAMPMGVALRIDKALAAEAEGRTADGGLRLDEAPDWNRIMSDSPWETAPAPVPEPALTPARPLRSVPPARTAPVPVPVAAAPLGAPVPSQAGPPADEVPVPLGVVSDDGSIVPARRRPGRSSRRRSWLMPAAASVAAAAVIGSVGVTASLLSASGGQPSGPTVALPAPAAPAPAVVQPQRGTIGKGSTQTGGNYAIGKSDFNYSDAVLDGPLATYVGATGPGSGGGTSADQSVTGCVSQIAARVGRRLGADKAPTPIGVDQGLYQGNEATVMAFWKDRLRNAVWVYVVDGNCASLRKPAVGRWQ
ncbi:anti-sigma factor family protein [Sphaerisporangium aureirubrum]|uniref:Zinc-finger domain-containing protein n=1 Tax=Sphaerisporangium aureirubrum TaxID=1544736 RepID=A0ABW1NQK7_9ACTN